MSCRKQGGSNEAVAKLIKLKARTYAHHPSLGDYTEEDLEQEMWIKWQLHGSGYNGNRGDLLTFADVMFNNFLKNLIEAQEAEMRDHRLCIASLDDPVDSEDESGTTRHDIYSPDDYFSSQGGRHPGSGQAVDMRMDIARVLEQLPPKHRALAQLLADQSVTDAAEILGISRETATVWRRRIREAFLKAGLQDYMPTTSEKPLRRT